MIACDDTMLVGLMSAVSSSDVCSVTGHRETRNLSRGSVSYVSFLTNRLRCGMIKIHTEVRHDKDTHGDDTATYSLKPRRMLLFLSLPPSLPPSLFLSFASARARARRHTHTTSNFDFNSFNQEC